MTQEQAAELIAENLQTLYSYALSRTGHREDAQDLAGDIVLSALESIHRLKDDGAFWGFFWAIAENNYRNYMRKRVKERSIHVSEKEYGQAAYNDTYAIEGDSGKAADLVKLKRELSLLGFCHRECTILYYFEGKKCSEIASRLGLSLDMVKYYLFKTRKLLKEGIGMERTFGEKSYRPGKFEFCTVFAGISNGEYSNLFRRRLPGQILLTAYYSPVTIRDLCMELGVSSVYMEDEVALLARYHLIDEVSNGRFQTNLVIYTEDYMEALWRELDGFVPEAVHKLIGGMRKKLPRIRALGFAGAALEENILLWDLYVCVLFAAIYSPINGAYQTEIYPAAMGVNYGLAAEIPQKYSTNGFAGRGCDIENAGYDTFVDFGIFREKGYVLDRDPQALKAQLRGMPEDKIPSFTEGQRKAVEEILTDETDSMREIFERIQQVMKELFREMAPAGVGVHVEEIVHKVHFFLTIGYFGAAAVESGTLAVPGQSDYAGIFVNLTCKDGEDGV